MPSTSIGGFVFEFSRFEGILKDSLATMLKTSSNQCDVLMPAMDSSFVCNACIASLSQYFADEKTRDRAASLVHQAKALNDQRGRVVHGLWILGETTAAIHTSRNNLKQGEYFGAEGEFDGLARRMVEIRAGLYVLFNTL